MLVFVLIDCVCNGFADHFWEPTKMEIVLVLCVLSLLLHIGMIMLFFMLLWHTFLLRYGLLIELWNEFRGVFLFSFLRFGVLAASRIPRLLAAVEYWPPTAYWDSPLHHGMYFVHNLVTPFFDAWLLRRCYALARVRYYKPQLWQQHRRRQLPGKVLGSALEAPGWPLGGPWDAGPAEASRDRSGKPPEAPPATSASSAAAMPGGLM
jgi:hypothetical protein